MSGLDSSAGASHIEARAQANVPDWLFMACGLSWGAALIHVAAAIGHLAESGVYALCFALLAPAQLAWGFLVCRRCSRRLLVVGLVLSLGVAAVWCLSRTTGLPVGPDPWQPERVGAVDSIATADELMLALLVWGYGVCPVPGRVRGVVGPLVKAGALVLVVLSSLALMGDAHVS